jgi:hypothetical protein
MVPVINLALNDANKKFTELPLHWNDDISLSLNGATRFLGRIDSLLPSYDKKGARILNVKGRHTGGAALSDYVANLQVTDTADKIVEAIIDLYTSMRGSTYTADPEITIKSNLAPDDITMAFDWRRKNFWKMLNELQEPLGASTAEGGADEFFDFYFDPATTGDFYFEPTGTQDSEVVITENVEIIKAKRNLDGIPVKNNIYLWCNATAGAVPFEMEAGWSIAQHFDPPVTAITDPWTEGNATDYDSYNCSDRPAPTLEDYPDPPNPIGGDRVVGSECIRISGMISAIGGGLTNAEKNAYWYMNFEHGGKFHTKLDGFTNQDPNDMLNLSNETHMAESMGEVAAIAFYLKTLSDNWPFEIQCVDLNNHRVRGPPINSKQTTGVWYNPFDQPKTEWGKEVVMAIGPSATTWGLMSGDTFDWTSIKQIRFAFGGKTGPFDFLFDGFRFIKPLIANSLYVSVESREKSCRSVVTPKERIIDYESALLVANGLIEQQKRPSTYWDIESIGRADIPSGAKFKIGDLELLMREQRWQFTKESGWILTGKAWEKT